MLCKLSIEDVIILPFNLEFANDAVDDAAYPNDPSAT